MYHAAFWSLFICLLSSLCAGPEEDKVQPCLRELCHHLENEAKSSSTTGFSDYSNALLRVNPQGLVQVYICVKPWQDQLVEHLKEHGLGVEIVNPALCTVQGWLPFEKIHQIAAFQSVCRVRAPVYARTRTGSVNSEGDSILKAPDVRAMGFTGSGVKIGVISDGVDGRQTAMSSGDLPTSLQIGSVGFGSEGVAMLEIIHDLSPGASLAFSSGNTSLEFIASVTILRNFSCRIIVDDLGFPEESYFEDGDVAKAAQAAVDAGVFFCSAAGNEALEHYEGDFSGLGPRTLAGQALNDVHDFGNGDFRCRIFIPAGRQISVFFQWNNLFNAAADNYDLFLFSEDGGQLLASSTNVQNGDDDPQETLLFGPVGGNLLADLVISRTAGSNTRRLEFFVDRATLQEFNVAAGSIVGHPAASGVFAVGAIDANDPGNDAIQNFSSQGPCQIFFPAQVSRSKPQISGIDNVSVSGAGGFQSPFLGTSAAAPHLAAIAALLLSARSDLTATQLASSLQNSAVDLGASGQDFLFGSGRADAVAALANAQGLPAPQSGGGSAGGGGGGGGGGGVCYIATAAYGSSTASSVEFLRRFRDQALIPTQFGNDTVSTYYEHSPALARFIRKKQTLRSLTRALIRIPVGAGEGSGGSLPKGL